MFDIGFSELLMIAVVALLVLGPERLPKAARFAGLWVRKARAQWYSVKSEFEREMAADEMQRSLAKPVQDLRREVEDAGRELGQSVRDTEALARAGTPDDPADDPSPEAPAIRAGDGSTAALDAAAAPAPDGTPAHPVRHDPLPP